MINFSVGPVMSSKEVRKIAYQQVPYFRTNDFSNIMFENEKLVKKFLYCSNDSKVVFLTGSGTASMDAAVLNTLTKEDKILIVNGGSFGHRFCEICDVYGLNYTEIKCEFGKTLTKEQLYKYDDKGYTALLVNLDETSTGVLYDIEMISLFCKKNNIFLIVDSISSFLCDSFNMKELNVNVVLTGSQKALAVAPGVSIIALDNKALERINKNKVVAYYLDLKPYLKNMERGQTPFTPAVGILLQLNKRLKTIDENGGVEIEISKTKERALYFRNAIKDLPFEIYPDTMSNAVTALTLKNKDKSAYKVFETLKDEYGIWICPNGGELKDKVFRVGHIGDLKISDYKKLIKAFKSLQKRNII